MCFGGGECFLNDEGLAAADGVPRDHPEVVGGILLEPADLYRGLTGGHHLLPRLLPDLLPLHDVLLDPGPAVALRRLPLQLKGVLGLPLHGGGAPRRGRLIYTGR